MRTRKAQNLPALDCGICGFRTCTEFARQLQTNPALIKRCIHLCDSVATGQAPVSVGHRPQSPACETPERSTRPAGVGCFTDDRGNKWIDSLGREFDFILEHFPEDPGPRETILPHNPMITRELAIQAGDILIGRPLGMSCGCPITHCGIAVRVDQRTGVLDWCVTGPLKPRRSGYKDLGYYAAEGYEGLVRESRRELKIGMRYFFQPRMCMLQWRHSGLVNYLNRSSQGLQVRLEGLWIG